MAIKRTVYDWLVSIYDRIGPPRLATVSEDIGEISVWGTPQTGTHTTTGATEEPIVTTALTDPYRFWMLIDLAAMVAGDDFTFRVHQRIDGTNLRLKDEQRFTDAQTIDVYEIDGIYGDTDCDIQVTVQRGAATPNRAFPYRWNVLKEP